MAYRHVIWDFNGTLLDDTELGINIINSMLAKRGLASLSRQQYLEIFGFPILDYYSKAGFDFEKYVFAELADEYIALYDAGFESCSLHKGARQAIEQIREAGLTQSVLTASSQSAIERQLGHFGIAGYFSPVTGDSDHHASGKVKLVGRHMSSLDVPRGEILFIGDTLHDKEVADEIGCSCLLASFGHQNGERLKQTGLPVVGSFDEILAHIFGNRR